MRSLLSLFVLVLLALPLPAAANPEAVKESFQIYQAALLRSDGAKAAEVVTQSSRDLYRGYADQALTYDRADLERLHVVDRLSILLMRHDLPREELARMTGAEIIAYAVERGWIDKEGTARIRLGNYQVESDFATGTLLQPDGGETPFKVEFRKEDDQWRLDLVKMMEIGRYGIEHAIKQTGMSEDQFVFYVLEVSTGVAPGPEIWNPPS